MGERASLDGCVFAKGVLMSDPQYRLPFEFASPGGDRFVVGDNQVVGFDVELWHIPNKLPLAVGHDGLSVSKLAGFCYKGEPGAVLKISEWLHIEQALPRQT